MKRAAFVVAFVLVGMISASLGRVPAAAGLESGAQVLSIYAPDQQLVNRTVVVTGPAQGQIVVCGGVTCDVFEVVGLQKGLPAVPTTIYVPVGSAVDSGSRFGNVSVVDFCFVDGTNVLAVVEL